MHKIAKIMVYNILVSNKRKKLPIAKLIIWLMLFAFLGTSILPLFAKDEGMSLHEKQEMLNKLNKEKSSIATKLKEARLKEAYASEKLREIQGRLSHAQSKLKSNQKYFAATQMAWTKTRKRLDEIEEQQDFLENEAKFRMVSIYKQQRVKLLDGLLNSSSVTDFLDHLYYQKRVIDYDRKVIQALIDQSKNIKQYNDTLAKEAKKMEDITSRLRSIENEIASQKNAQNKVVSKLKSETAVYQSAERQLEKESIKLIYKISKLSGDKMDNPDATGTFKYPLQARITSPFGPRRHPIFGVRSMHSGIDLAAPRGTDVKASEGGLVIYAGWYGGYGRVVIVDHSKGYSTLYAHLDKIKVKVGKRVRQGQVLGDEGQTGYATGPHLHFEVRSQGRPQNPVLYLADS